VQSTWIHQGQITPDQLKRAPVAKDCGSDKAPEGEEARGVQRCWTGCKLAAPLSPKR